MSSGANAAEAYANFASFLSPLAATTRYDDVLDLTASPIIICPDCGKGNAFRGRCPKCGGNSWIPAGSGGGVGLQQLREQEQEQKQERLREHKPLPDVRGAE